MIRNWEPLIAGMYCRGITYAEAVREFRRRFVLQVLLANRGNQCKAAEELGVHRNTMRRMLDGLEIDRAEVRAGLKHPPQSEHPSFDTKRSSISFR